MPQFFAYINLLFSPYSTCIFRFRNRQTNRNKLIIVRAEKQNNRHENRNTRRSLATDFDLEMKKTKQKCVRYKTAHECNRITHPLFANLIELMVICHHFHAVQVFSVCMFAFFPFDLLPKRAKQITYQCKSNALRRHPQILRHQPKKIIKFYGCFACFARNICFNVPCNRFCAPFACMISKIYWSNACNEVRLNSMSCTRVFIIGASAVVFCVGSEYAIAWRARANANGNNQFVHDAIPTKCGTLCSA